VLVLLNFGATAQRVRLRDDALETQLADGKLFDLLGGEPVELDAGPAAIALPAHGVRILRVGETRTAD
jgi:hypothetical protein